MPRSDLAVLSPPARQPAGAPSTPLPLTMRALLAVTLTVGFYLLAVGMAAALFYIPYAQWTYTDSVTAQLAFFCVAGGLAIVWSILPRPGRFVAPGPRLEASVQPELFQVIREVAAATGQPMPSEVYLVPDLNAWVGHRGGVFGLVARRQMGLGLPLLQLLTVDQLRAVLAHEFGHYVGGDTRLGPWIYRTRSAIGRTLAELQGSILQKPFVLYGELFLRITLAISRRQELAADALAARVAGPAQLIGGLEAVHAAGPAFERYWHGEVVPVLSHGYRVPIAEGFKRFVVAAPIASMVQQQLEREMGEGAVRPYDTHPPLRERIAAVQGIAAAPASPDARCAVALLAEVDALEVELLGTLGDRSTVLQRLAWEDLGTFVYLPVWQQASERHAAAFGGLTPAAFPRVAEKLAAYSERFEFEALERTSPEVGAEALSEEKQQRALFLTGAALTTALVKRGWRARVQPGEQVVVEHGGVELAPFDVIPALAAETMSTDTWLALCERAGIRELDLGAALRGNETETGISPAR